MNYDLDKSQNLLKDEAHKFLAKECPSDFVRQMAADEDGFSEQIWHKMAKLDWMGLLVPEKFGGLGGNFIDLAVLLSAMGYHCLPGPFFSAVVLGGLVILEAANDTQKADILPALSEGKRLLTLAWVEQDGTYIPEGIKMTAAPQGEKYILNGTKLFVPYARTADAFICVAATGDSAIEGPPALSLFVVDAKQPGIHIHPLYSLAGDKQCEVVFDKVSVSTNNMLGDPAQGWSVLKKVLQMAAVAKCAEMSGGAQRVMEMTVQYVKDREQFGRPVGAFQAVQHHCANMLTYADTIKYMTYQAAWLISAGAAFEKQASMCKAWASDSYRKLVALAHQSIGGIAFMEEYDLQLYFKQAKAAEQMLGDAEFHRELVAEQIGLG